MFPEIISLVDGAVLFICTLAILDTIFVVRSNGHGEGMLTASSPHKGFKLAREVTSSSDFVTFCWSDTRDRDSSLLLPAAMFSILIVPQSADIKRNVLVNLWLPF